MIFFSLEKNRFLFFEKEKKKSFVCVFFGACSILLSIKKKSSSFLSRYIKITCVCVKTYISLIL